MVAQSDWLPIMMPTRGASVVMRSRDDVGTQLVLEARHLVLELQLAPLQPRQVELVRCAGSLERGDLVVELAVLEAELHELLPDRTLLITLHAGGLNGLLSNLGRNIVAFAPMRKAFGLQS